MCCLTVFLAKLIDIVIFRGEIFTPALLPAKAGEVHPHTPLLYIHPCFSSTNGIMSTKFSLTKLQRCHNGLRFTYMKYFCSATSAAISYAKYT